MSVDQLGLSEHQIRRLVAEGVLHREGRGVYAVGYPRRDDEARAWRAVLGYPRTGLSFVAAAWAHGLRPELPRTVHLSSLTRRREVPGVRIHRVRVLELVKRRGLPCTTLAQTLLDCAATLPADQLTKLIHRAEELRTFDLRPILPLLEARHGAPELRRALELHRAQADFTHSELERRFRALIAASPLPRPQEQRLIGPYYVDAVYIEQRIAIELDGGTHLTPSRHDADTRRDADLITWGWRPVRFTWRQVTQDPRHVVRTIAALL